MSIFLNAATALGSRSFMPDYVGQGWQFMAGFNYEQGVTYLGQEADKVSAGRYKDKPLGPLAKSGAVKGGQLSFVGSQLPVYTSGMGRAPSFRTPIGTNMPSRVPGMSLGAGAFNLIGPLASGYFITKGYQEDGIRGATDAAIWDLAVSSATAKYAYSFNNTSVLGAKLSGLERMAMTSAGVSASDINKKSKYIFTSTKMRGLPGLLGIGLAASVGGTIGQEALGGAGAFMGAFVGANAGRLFMNKWGAGFALAGALGAGASNKIIKGGTTVLKQGYDRRQRRKRIDTAGSTAAFFTENANTMRSRAILAMRNSHLNARSALGMEATYTHLDRNYFSPYKAR